MLFIGTPFSNLYTVGIMNWQTLPSFFVKKWINVSRVAAFVRTHAGRNPSCQNVLTVSLESTAIFQELMAHAARVRRGRCQ